MIPGTLSGVFAALPTPFRSDGGPDFERISAHLDFLLDRGIVGICASGATGEYAALSLDDRIRIFEAVAGQVNGRASLICGVGAEHFGQVMRLAHAAAGCGAAAVLLPPPSFFRFSSAELLSFLSGAAAQSPLPVILYHIPQFTRSVSARGLIALVGASPNVVGIKDSSGVAANLSRTRDAKAKRPFAFFIGSDELLVEALEFGADGVISGTASAFPELIGTIYKAFRSGHREMVERHKGLLDEYLSRSAGLPPAWSVKLALASRGIEFGELGWPPRGKLSERAEHFQEWLEEWHFRRELSTGAAMPCSE